MHRARGLWSRYVENIRLGIIDRGGGPRLGPRRHNGIGGAESPDWDISNIPDLLPRRIDWKEHPPLTAERRLTDPGGVEVAFLEHGWHKTSILREIHGFEAA
jgi:hypothetical protein